MKLFKAALAAALSLGAVAPAIAQPPAAGPARPVRLRSAQRRAQRRGGAAATASPVPIAPRRIRRWPPRGRRRAAPRAAMRSAITSFEIADRRGDAALRAQAVDLLVDSGLATPAELGPLLASQASRSLDRERSAAHRAAARPHGRAAAEQPGGAGRLCRVQGAAAASPATPCCSSCARDRGGAGKPAGRRRKAGICAGWRSPSKAGWRRRRRSLARVRWSPIIRAR